MSLKIIRSGILDTVQDAGRSGFQHLGINPGGNMDPFSSALANALLGKPLSDPLIEMHFPAPEIEITGPAVFVLTGADFSPMLDGSLINPYQPVMINETARLTFQKRISGYRCYLSLYNQLQIPKWLNSHSTNIKAGAGGWKGRRLQAGDEIFFANKLKEFPENTRALPWRLRAANQKQAFTVLKGNEWSWLKAEEQQKFLAAAFEITTSSDRMGYRLSGPALAQATRESMITSPVNFGTIQLLPDGQCIVLMADHQTTGGYPRIAHVTTADLGLLAQCAPGDNIRFQLTSQAEAEMEWMKQQNYLHELENTCKLKIEKFLHGAT